MDKYDQLKQLGKGSYGTVFLVREKNSRGRMWCMKKINLQGLGGRERQASFLEVKLLRELRHPHVVSYQDSFLHKPTNQLCLVMSFCEGGDLHRRVQQRKKEGGRLFTEARVVAWLLQLTLALEYIHDRHSIIHRDLKTQNVFLMEDGTTLKLGDFGVSRQLDLPTDLARTCVGTPFYMCPELMRKQRYSNKADMWALGERGSAWHKLRDSLCVPAAFCRLPSAGCPSAGCLLLAAICSHARTIPMSSRHVLRPVLRQAACSTRSQRSSMPSTQRT